jgi:ABC-2 type transport system permease protein
VSAPAVAHPAGPRGAAGWATLAARLRAAAWLGLQIESNWTDPFMFTAYVVAFPLATAFILVGMYWSVGGHSAATDAFRGFYVGSAFHNYVVMALVGMGWVIVEERELYETLKYVYTSPIGMFNYLAGRSLVKLVLASLSAALALAVGWFAVGLRWDWQAVRWLPLLFSFGVGLFAVVSFGFFVAGVAMVMPRAAFAVNDGVVVALYLLCGVIFPLDLLPRALQWVSLALPFTWWYEALRRFLLGHGASARLGRVPDAALVGALVATTLVFSVAAHFAYLALERRARQLGRLDQTTVF